MNLWQEQYWHYVNSISSVRLEMDQIDYESELAQAFKAGWEYREDMEDREDRN